MTEEDKDNEIKRKHGILIREMVNTEGYKEVFLPFLRSRKQSFFQGLLRAKTIEEFVSAQQCYNSFEQVEQFLISVLVTGSEADKQLQQQSDGG
jgi:hypothetical protein